MKTFFPTTLVTALLLSTPVWAAAQQHSQDVVQTAPAVYQLAQNSTGNTGPVNAPPNTGGAEGGTGTSSQSNSGLEQPLSAREKPQEAPIYRPGARDNLQTQGDPLQNGTVDAQTAPDGGLQRDLDANDAQDAWGIAPIFYWLIVPLGLGLMLLYYATSRHKAETAQRREAHPKV